MMPRCLEQPLWSRRWGLAHYLRRFHVVDSVLRSEVERYGALRRVLENVNASIRRGAERERYTGCRTVQIITWRILPVHIPG